MNVDDLTGPFVVIATPHESLIDVASRMRFNDVGSAIVVSEGEVAGIITERDLVQAVADGAKLTHASVAEYMTAEPTTVAPAVDCVVAATMMARQGIAHLPVVDGGRLTGVISQRDLVSELLLERVVR